MRLKRLEKRSPNKSLDRRLVLDTTYVLPMLGIEVEGLERETLNHIIKHYELYYPATLLVELEGVVFKEAKRRGLENLPEQVVEGFNSIVYAGVINIISPVGEDLKVIYYLVKLGWKDIFDAALYATALRLNAKALTMDEYFKKFLKKRGLQYDLLITHKELK